MSKKKRVKTNKRNRSTKLEKAILFEKYGTYCWLCGKQFKSTQLTGHHAIPFRICNCTKLDNILLACEHCHFDIINYVKYPSKEYDELMEKMRKFRDNIGKN